MLSVEIKPKRCLEMLSYILSFRRKIPCPKFFRAQVHLQATLHGTNFLLETKNNSFNTLIVISLVELSGTLFVPVLAIGAVVPPLVCKRSRNIGCACFFFLKILYEAQPNLRFLFLTCLNDERHIMNRWNSVIFYSTVNCSMGSQVHL